MIESEFLELKEKLIKIIGNSLKVEKFSLAEEELLSLTNEQATEIAIYFGNQLLLRLPKKERDFFDWLKASDYAVWHDLWGEDEDPYLVGINFLPDLLPKGRGFPICDLVTQQNFYFTQNDITSDNGVPYCDAALEAIKHEIKIRMDQAFIIEIWRAPIDQWRFAYMYNMPLDTVKEMVLWLLNEGILEFPKQEEGLSEAIEASTDGVFSDTDDFYEDENIEDENIEDENIGDENIEDENIEDENIEEGNS